jgi:hypothetical protein
MNDKPLARLAALVGSDAPDEWYVTDGATAVGPVTLELLARGLAAGKVPSDAFVRHESWNGWRDLGDLAEHDPSFDPRRTFRVLPAAKLPPEKIEPRETLDSIDLVEDVDEPAARQPLSAFDAATDLSEALLLLMATVVEELGVSAALVHRATGDHAIVACSHGPRMFELLGERLPQSDPVLFAAKQAQTLFAEPVPGVGGRTIKKRLSRLGARVEGAFMVPIVEGGRLLALLEGGRLKPLSARDVAKVEELAASLVDAAKRAGWELGWKPPTNPLEPVPMSVPPSRPSG